MRYQQKIMRIYGKMKGENGLRRTMLWQSQFLERKKLASEFLTLSVYPLSPKKTLHTYQIFFERGDLGC